MNARRHPSAYSDSELLTFARIEQAKLAHSATLLRRQSRALSAELGAVQIALTDAERRLEARRSPLGRLQTAPTLLAAPSSPRRSSAASDTMLAIEQRRRS